MAKYKIWWQSSTAIDGFPDYKKAIEEHGKKMFNPDFEIEVHGVPKGTNDLGFMSFEFLNNQIIMNNLFEAVEKGFDAIALGCFLDPVLQEAREVIDIPILGMAETAMLWGCMYGKRSSIVTYDPIAAKKKLPQLIYQYGFSERMAPVFNFELSLEALGTAFKDPKNTLELFSAACHRAVEQGAEVILPGCGLLNLVAVQNNLNQVGETGVPIMDVSGALMKTAEAAVILQKKSGLNISRSGFYKTPGKEIAESVRKICR